MPLAGPTPWGHQLTDKGFPFIPLPPKPLLGGCSCSLAEERASSRRAPKGLLLLLLQKCPQPSPARQPSGSGRGGGKAIDLDILAGSRPRASARDDSIHRDTHLKKKKKKRRAQKPSLVLLTALPACSAVRSPESMAHCIATHTHPLFLPKICSQTRPSTACANPHVNHYSANSNARAFGY